MPELEPQYLKEFKGEMHSFKGEMISFKDEMKGFAKETKESFVLVNSKLDKHTIEINEIQNTLKVHTRQLDSHFDEIGKLMIKVTEIQSLFSPWNFIKAMWQGLMRG